MSRTAILVDFGGVLTTDVFAAFRRFGAQIGPDPDLPISVIVTDPVVGPAFADLESGHLDDEEFEILFARKLTERGATVEPAGLLGRIKSGIALDPDMIALIEGVRAAGHPVALVSNSMGRDSYAGVDLAALVDVAIVSAEVGLRKPAREIYRLACRELGVEPGEAVMLDDLRHNIDGARRCGIEGIVHSSAASTAEELAVRFGVFPVLPPTTTAPENRLRRGTRQWLR
ncbi:putative hydrolase of the HAD superfamily [Nocardia tenerifensis]|uniref:Putative hydrolase of the HAD superfamily n=1 Tax=Nocardia tenerifensis TaxID=228006 RepID=A0A318K8V4_9NOCA|nr:HAD family phosphatase [Nocardia tenerifensis]PXX70961.1 putative hydrolase of the HAD superfamily [Nocardia tenerifensis]